MEPVEFEWCDQPKVRVPMSVDTCIPSEARELLQLDLRLLDLLAILYENRSIRIETLVERHEIFYYTDGERLSLEDVKPLEELALTSKKIIDRVLRCPKCDYREVDVKLQCPNCGSTNIERVRIIQHRICGYIDLEISFRQDGRLVCPHCHTPILSENDYRVLGTLYYCYNCRARFHEPDVMLVCRRCRARFRPADAAYKPVYGLVLTDKARRLLENVYDFRTALYRALEERRMRFECDTKLEGRSGVTYEVDFYIPSARLGIDIEPRISSHNDAIYFTLKARDLHEAGYLERLVVVTRKATQESLAILSNSRYVLLLHRELPSKLVGLVDKILQGGWEALGKHG